MNLCFTYTYYISTLVTLKPTHSVLSNPFFCNNAHTAVSVLWHSAQERLETETDSLKHKRADGIMG